MTCTFRKKQEVPRAPGTVLNINKVKVKGLFESTRIIDFQTSTSTWVLLPIRHNTLCIFHCGPGFVVLFDKNATLPPPNPMHCFPKHTGTQLHFFRHSVPVVILAHVSIGKPGRHCKNTKSVGSVFSRQNQRVHVDPQFRQGINVRCTVHQHGQQFNQPTRC